MMRLSLLLFCFILTSCDPSPSVTEMEPPVNTLPNGVKELSPTEAVQWLRNHPDALILDMRMPEEILREGKIEGSKNYDFLQSQTLEQLSELDAKKPCLVYCALGGRSQKAVKQLHDLGFSQMVLLKGGLNAWLAEGKPVNK